MDAAWMGGNRPPRAPPSRASASFIIVGCGRAGSCPEGVLEKPPSNMIDALSRELFEISLSRRTFDPP
jgi:hypothetical protein